MTLRSTFASDGRTQEQEDRLSHEENMINHGGVFDWAQAQGSKVQRLQGNVDANGRTPITGISDPLKDQLAATTGVNLQQSDGGYYTDTTSEGGGGTMGPSGNMSDFTNVGLGGSARAGTNANYWQNQSSSQRGPQAYENQDLSDRESASRYGDQSGALQLQREAAMGMAPSAAAYQMQRGLDQSLGAQQAQMGSARGNAGIAMASGNAAANSANLMNQTYNQAGQLRAAEMASGRQGYGDLASQQRGQDLNRLGMGNDMANRNADRNDNYALGAGGLANQFGTQGLGWYGAAGNAAANGANNELGWAQLGYNQQNDNANRKQGAAVYNADMQGKWVDRGLQAGSMLATYGASSAMPRPTTPRPSGIGGSTPTGTAPAGNTYGQNYTLTKPVLNGSGSS